MSNLMSPVEVEEYLGVSPYVLRKWRSRGQGPRFIRIENRIRYRRADVDEWVDHNVPRLCRTKLPEPPALDMPGKPLDGEGSPFMSRHRAARYLGVSHQSLETWAREGRGPIYLKIKGRIVYHRADLDEYRNCYA